VIRLYRLPIERSDSGRFRFKAGCRNVHPTKERDQDAERRLAIKTMKAPGKTAKAKTVRELPGLHLFPLIAFIKDQRS